jgi:hypothetical protein
MKKFITICLFAILGIAVNAQFSTPIQFPVITGDTITNTGTANKIVVATAGYSQIAIQPVITKTSGTVGGNCVLYGSLDGANYVSTGDTLKCTNQTTNTSIFKVTNAPYWKYKAVYTGTGTMVATWKVWYVLRKRITQ